MSDDIRRVEVKVSDMRPVEERIALQKAHKEEAERKIAKWQGQMTFTRELMRHCSDYETALITVLVVISDQLAVIADNLSRPDEGAK